METDTRRPPPAVLVVDDEAMIRISLADYLEDCGYDVAVAASGKEALCCCAERPFDLIIVDNRLPDMYGAELIGKVSTLSARTRFLIHTGSLDYVLPRELAQSGIGVEHVFIKPVKDMAQILETIRSLVG